eukprot:CAMPEP_0201696838 /NCGR_PEP_ID=MMETSP0578-20130828/8358_1 /ASSEMBLY_ACC=CAM_ASM_000663 /TAXON_ID=267565 /ORGANISM="Skeletonema grethea, Strain CCMP 1804" /LENGTH=342 /DNA_ID=CAMNT_0048182869 /DNA_START=613 /DNA_END=1638 /DNA_ORIENTATION=-
MKCILASAHGEDIDSLLSMCDNYPVPTRKKGQVLIKVSACALAPGDVRVLAGHIFIQDPPGGFPYIPGGDISGQVVEADSNSRFKPGDPVVALFKLPRPLNGLAEFIAVEESLVELASTNIPIVESSTLTSSALTAMMAANKYCCKGNRVLVLGGSGGVGCFLIQLLKARGASFIATTSTRRDLMLSLGADVVINYKDENWFESSELRNNKQFDLIIEPAVGYDAWRKAMQFRLLKTSAGKFVALTADDALVEAHNWWQLSTVFIPMQWRELWTKVLPSTPQYIWHNGLNVQSGDLANVTKLVEDGTMKIVLDRVSPLAFTEKGVKEGFIIMKRRSAHGKVV